MIRIGAGIIAEIESSAVAAKPNEVCGFLVGAATATGTEVTRLVPSPNIAPEPETRFEIDPAIYFGLRRRLSESGETIVGIYHSHPAGPPEPSSEDLAAANEPDWIWLICGHSEDNRLETRAFQMCISVAGGPANDFRPLDMVVV